MSFDAPPSSDTDIWVMPYLNGTPRPNGKTDWKDIKRRIIEGLGPEGVAREYANLGVRFEGSPDGKGKIQCHAADRPDDVASAFIDCRNGIYHTQGGSGETLNLFDFALRYGGPAFGDWLTTIKYYAGLSNVPITARKDNKGRIVEATYGYSDENSELIYEVIRYRLSNGKKDFRQRRPDGKGDWIYDLEGVRRVLYRLPELIAQPDYRVVVVEGEKDADRLNDLFKASGLSVVATTSAQGADSTKQWETHKESLRGRSCIVIPDNDAPGSRHATGICSFLHGVASDVRLVVLPDVGAKEDVSDWLDQGHTLDELWDLAQKTPEFDPTNVPVEAQIAKNVPSPKKLRPGWACTDLGNAERMASHFGPVMRYCKPWKNWLTWNGQRWALDDLGRINVMAKATMRRIYEEAANARDQAEREMYAKWAIKCESAAKINSMLQLVCWESDIPILPATLDPNPWLFNCPNGTVDLETGKLRTHDRSDLITRMSPVEFDPSASCPLWEEFVNRIFAGNRDLIGFIQRLCGLALTGDVSEQILPIFFGEGGNGKSTLLNALLDIMGPDYAIMAPPGLLFAKQNEGHPTDKASLFGMRLVIDMESAEGARLNEAIVKQLTGSDRISARRMREDFWTFLPTHKLIVCTNNQPAIAETKNAIWRRLKLVPFTVEIPEAEQKADLPRLLKAEFPGILAWCVRGCVDWVTRGLQTPDVIQKATSEYRAEEDTLTAFINEECLIGDSYRVKASMFYRAYLDQLDQSGPVRVTQTSVGRAMKKKGFEKKISDGKWYIGIALRSNHVESRKYGDWTDSD